MRYPINRKGGPTGGFARSANVTKKSPEFVNEGITNDVGITNELRTRGITNDFGITEELRTRALALGCACEVLPNTNTNELRMRGITNDEGDTNDVSFPSASQRSPPTVRGDVVAEARAERGLCNKNSNEVVSKMDSSKMGFECNASVKIKSDFLYERSECKTSDFILLNRSKIKNLKNLNIKISDAHVREEESTATRIAVSNIKISDAHEHTHARTYARQYHGDTNTEGDRCLVIPIDDQLDIPFANDEGMRVRDHVCTHAREEIQPTATRIAVKLYQRSEAAESIAAWAKKGLKKVVQDCGDELQTMLENDDWSKVCSVHVVELFIRLHERVYGVTPPELDSYPSRKCASATVSKFAKRVGGVRLLIGYLRWSWEREEWKVVARKRHNCDRMKRLTFRRQFGIELWGDYMMNNPTRKAK